jgi:hypothetical protein
VAVNGQEPCDDGVAVLEEEDVVLEDYEGVAREEDDDIIEPILEEDEDEDEAAFQVTLTQHDNAKVPVSSNIFIS